MANKFNELSVYVAEFSDGVVKVGISNEPEQRRKSLPGDRRKRIGDFEGWISYFWHSSSLDYKEAHRIEDTVLLRFFDHRINMSEYLEGTKFCDVLNVILESQSINPAECSSSETWSTLYESYMKDTDNPPDYRTRLSATEAKALTEIKHWFSELNSSFAIEKEMLDRAQADETLKTANIKLGYHLAQYRYFIEAKIVDLILECGKEILKQRGYIITTKEKLSSSTRAATAPRESHDPIQGAGYDDRGIICSSDYGPVDDF